MKLLKFCKRYWFLIGLFVVPIVAYFVPEIACKGGLLRSEYTVKMGVFLIFLFQGLLLPIDAIKKGVKRWFYQFQVMAFIFIIAPLLGLLIGNIFGSWTNYSSLTLGIFYLSILPTTVSTALVYTNQAGGGSVEALVSITISNICAVFYIPVILNFFMSSSVILDIFPLLKKIVILIIVPLILGQFARVKIHKFTDSIKVQSSILSSVIVLFCILAAFSNSIQSDLWSAMEMDFLIYTVLAVLIFYMAMQAITFVYLKLTKMNYFDAVPFWLTTTLKSIAVGAPLAGIIFEGNQSLGLIMIPLMMYAFIQLLIGGVVTNYLCVRRLKTFKN